MIIELSLESYSNYFFRGFNNNKDDNEGASSKPNDPFLRWPASFSSLLAISWIRFFRYPFIRRPAYLHLYLRTKTYSKYQNSCIQKYIRDLGYSERLRTSENDKQTLQPTNDYSVLTLTRRPVPKVPCPHCQRLIARAINSPKNMHKELAQNYFLFFHYWLFFIYFSLFLIILSIFTLKICEHNI